ncbi:orotidine-5'-phosphate decarboxylase [Roseivirga sp. UBA1976]|uniref:orotidine-5'-phosphate decarboxylase n=1 Tax=Roseivirga sp. UBA1976 TaxID=1947386 RepID=UPI0025797661|nr:orotidine-5'-phosphate decarboxylase [Roseivirga sp. UBA1976]MEC7753953.1 orotidine-5'-phosphate decarboxylase [Bacteroidota bacterium]|tara:strand:- start:2999 stop:3814 length:816 start_codon:yes stop_codon:yes gene_type:complete
MNKKQLFDQIRAKASYLCVGLDSDIHKIPEHLRKADDPLFEFNKQIIDATIDYAVAYKPNIAFYEAHGLKGWESLMKTIAYLPDDVFIIADAKRGDIGNTSKMYARAFFEQMNCDAITVAPYMGEDSVKPFLDFPEKWVILLALTSNAGGKDFQNLALTEGDQLYERVLKKSQDWGSDEELMYVVGATKAEALTNIRQIVPNHFLLVPGVGAQGGSLSEVSRYGLNSQCGLLVNSSRGIIYADGSESFAFVAGSKARELQQEMANYLEKYC